MIRGHLAKSLAVACVITAPLCAQTPSVTYSWSWAEVVANSSIPSASTPGVIDSTEGVRFSLRAAFTPAIGSPITYTPPPGSGQGTVAGWGATYFEFDGAGGTVGTFSHGVVPPEFTLGPLFTTTPGSMGTGLWCPALLLGGTEINPNNPIEALVSFTWTPAAYTQRVISFTSRDAIVDPYPNTLGVRYGTSGTGGPLYVSVGAASNHGAGTGPITIVPGPPGLALLALGAAGMSRPRR